MRILATGLTLLLAAMAALAGGLLGTPAAAPSTQGASALRQGPVACPQGGPVSEAFARPRLPSPGEVLDDEPSPFIRGWRIVRGAGLKLPSGRLLESGGEYMGADGKPVRVASRPGPYPWFLILETDARTGQESPAFAQLVLDPAHPPVRWVEDGRFGFVTDGGVGFIGSPEAADALSHAHPYRRYQAWARTGTLCFAYQARDGARAVVYSNGIGDGGYPGAAGLDSRGRLVAVTWQFGEPWALGGFPGRPPRDVLRMTSCRRTLIGRGVRRQAATVRCLNRLFPPPPPPPGPPRDLIDLHVADASQVIADGRNIWVLEAARISRRDAATGRPRWSTPADPLETRMVSAAGRVWVTPSSEMRRLDGSPLLPGEPAMLSLNGLISVEGAAAGSGGVWVATACPALTFGCPPAADALRLLALPALTEAVDVPVPQATVDSEGKLSTGADSLVGLIAEGAADLWTLRFDTPPPGATDLRIVVEDRDPATGAVRREVLLPGSAQRGFARPRDIAATAGAAWIITADSRLWRVGADGSVRREQGSYCALGTDGTSLWALTSDGDRLDRIDPATGKVVHTDHELRVASYYVSMAVSPQRVWITDAMLGRLIGVRRR